MSIKETPREEVSPAVLPIAPKQQPQLLSNSAEIVTNRSSDHSAALSGRLSPTATEKVSIDNSKRNSLEEIPMRSVSDDDEVTGQCNLVEVTSSLCEQYVSIKPKSFFDLFLIDTKRRVSVSLDKVVSSCSEVIRLQALRPCVLIEGESGTGKTTLLRHLAYQWAMKKALHEFSAVLLYEVYHYVDQREDGIGIDNLIYRLEKDSKLLHGSTNRSDILILLDSFWYLPTQSIIATCRKYFPKSAIVFTGQPDLVKAIKSKEIKSITHYYKILGYQLDTIDDAIQSLLTPSCKIETFHTWLQQNPFAEALVNCPLYCQMLTELFVSNSLPYYLVTLTELFRLYIILLINKSRKFSHPIEYFSDLTGDDDILFRSIVEMSHSLPKIYQTESCRAQLNESFGLLKVYDHHVVSFVYSSIMAYFMALFYTVSVNKPINAPFDWPLFCLSLAGTKNMDAIKIIQSDRRSILYQETIFQFFLMFELQLHVDEAFRSNSTFNCNFYYNINSMEADPIALYVFGWFCVWFSDCHFSKNITYHCSSFGIKFYISYVSEISKYLVYFCKGTKHNFYPSLSKESLDLRIEIINATDDVGECLRCLINTDLCRYLDTLIFSGTVNFSSFEKVAIKHFSGLKTLDMPVSGNPFPLIIPRLRSLHLLALHNKDSSEVDLKFFENVKRPFSIETDGFSPDFFVNSLKQNTHSRLTQVFIRNYCGLSPMIVKCLTEWVIQSNKRIFGLNGEGIVSVEAAVQIAVTLGNNLPETFKLASNSAKRIHDPFDNADYSTIYLNDPAMPSISLVPIVDAVSKLDSVQLHIPSKYFYEFGARPNLRYTDVICRAVKF